MGLSHWNNDPSPTDIFWSRPNVKNDEELWYLKRSKVMHILTMKSSMTIDGKIDQQRENRPSAITEITGGYR